MTRAPKRTTQPAAPTLPTSPARRTFLAGLPALALGAALPARAAPRTVTVLTSYPDELVSRFEKAFEQRHPEYRLHVIWRMPHDAAPYLRQPDQGGVDVYWAASPRTFAALAQDGLWRPLKVDRQALPDHVGKAALADPAGYYTASEMASFGFAVGPTALATHQLAEPRDWTDLAAPAWAGLIALPNPARVGFAPPLVEIVLQAYGWERGWALWSEIAANAVLIERGSTFVTDEITSGRCAVGISIDFFVNAAIANGAPVRFVYPGHTGINPAHLAMPKAAPNPAGGQAFIDFMLSREAQRSLTHPDIRRLPVRPDAYAGLPAGTFNPFAAAAAGGLDFDNELARPRLGLSAAVFEQMLAAPHTELSALWQRLRQAEAAGKPVAAARRLLGTPPLSEAEAADPTLREQFTNRLEGSAERPLNTAETRWRETCTRQRAEADRLLKEVQA